MQSTANAASTVLVRDQDVLTVATRDGRIQRFTSRLDNPMHALGAQVTDHPGLTAAALLDLHDEVVSAACEDGFSVNTHARFTTHHTAPAQAAFIRLPAQGPGLEHA